jgi:hypothetical protein
LEADPESGLALVSPGLLIVRYCYFFQLRGLPRLTTLTVQSAFGRLGLVLAQTRGALRGSRVRMMLFFTLMS